LGGNPYFPVANELAFCHFHCNKIVVATTSKYKKMTQNYTTTQQLEYETWWL